jgi:drug/metabolite transporter (DMT)-like permease
MIQRIQTIYLLLASILLSSMFLFSLAGFQINSSQIFELYSYGFLKNGKEFLPTYPLAILNGLVSIIIFVTIFLYKNRKLQMRTSILSMALVFMHLGLFYYYLITTAKSLNATIYYSISSAMPLLSILLVLLAYRSIRKDEELVKSADRIR